MEKSGYRENLALLSSAYPGRAMLSTAEAAKAANVNVKTIRKAIDQNKFPAMRLGEKICIPITGFAKWLCG